MPSAVDDEELIHPLLTTAVATAAAWCGYQAIHGGAIVAGDRAWAVMGERELGKSTLLARLEAAGVGIVADDLLVTREGAVFAGPRCLDLRHPPDDSLPPARRLRISVAGERERFRVDLRAVPAEIQLAGWIFLTWGEGLRVRRLRPPDVLRRLGPQRREELGSADPGALLLHAALPAYELARPPLWSLLGASADALLDVASNGAPV